MGKPSKAIQEFMEKFGVSFDEIWEVHGNSWVVKHKALERVAGEVGITWDRPAMIETNSATGVVALIVFGKLGDRTEWSTGEASPKNNKNAYPYAMAEKRAKDRVILKLLSVGGELYSSVDDFETDNARPVRQNPHVTRAADIVQSADYDDNGEVIDNVPHSPTAAAIRVKDARKIYEDLESEAWAFSDSKKFLAWMNKQATIDCVATGSAEWQKMFRGRCKEHLDALKLQEQDDDLRMAG